MTWTLDQMLRPALSRIDPALISVEQMGHVLGICAQMPGTLSSRIGFECPLGTADARADLLILMRREGSERETLAGRNPRYPFSPYSVTWKRIQRLAADWAIPSSALAAHMSNLWLEFDLDGAPSVGLPDHPNVFLGPTERMTEGSTIGEWLTSGALTTLLGSPLSASASEMVARCIAEQPSGTCVTHVGAMLQRPEAALRLVVSYIQRGQIVPYLARIGWMGPLAEIQEVLDTHLHLPEILLLDIDVGDTVRPRIGIEGMFEAPYLKEPRWPQWLAELERNGLCLPQKRRAVEAFSGWLDEINHRELWPEALLRASAILNRRSLSTIFLSMHHIKLVYEPGSPLRAKAYLGAGTQWVRGPA